MDEIKIEAYCDEMFGYTVQVNGETILECLSSKELKELTVGELIDLYNEFHEED